MNGSKFTRRNVDHCLVAREIFDQLEEDLVTALDGVNACTEAIENQETRDLMSAYAAGVARGAEIVELAGRLRFGQPFRRRIAGVSEPPKCLAALQEGKG